MKNLKKILALVLCLMMAAVLLTGCSKSLKGTWELVDSSDEDMIEDMKEEDGAMIFEFTKDEVTITIKDGKRSTSMTTEYEADDGVLTIEGEDIDYEIKGKKLILSNDGEELIFERK